MLQRAGVPVGISSLQKWLTQGRKDHSERKETAFGVFYALWRKNYAGRILDREPERMAEMKRALTMMNGRYHRRQAPSRRRKGCSLMRIPFFGRKPEPFTEGQIEYLRRYPVFAEAIWLIRAVSCPVRCRPNRG